MYKILLNKYFIKKYNYTLVKKVKYSLQYKFFELTFICIWLTQMRERGKEMTHFWMVGTDTDVGKTFCTVLMMRALQLQEQRKVTVFKPVQTGQIYVNGEASYYDTSMYKRFSLVPLELHELNSYSFKTPASPHLAARLEDARIDCQMLQHKLQELTTRYEQIICEGAGGLFVPLNEQLDCLIDVIQASSWPVVLVTKTGLGTINHTMLSFEALISRGIQVKGIMFNGYTDCEMENDNIATILRMTAIHTKELPYAIVPKVAGEEAIPTISLAESSLIKEMTR